MPSTIAPIEFARRGARHVAAWTLLASACAAGPAAAAVLFLQDRQTGPDRVAVASDGQTLLPAEDFTIASAAHTLSWWGTLGVDFSVQVYARSDLSTPLLDVLPSYAGLVPDGTMTIDGVEREIYRYDLDLGALAAGDYTVQIGELTADPAIVDVWYWVQGLGGDGAARYGLGDPAGGLHGFDLSLRLTGPDATVPLPGTLLLALAAVPGLARVGRRRERVVAMR